MVVILDPVSEDRVDQNILIFVLSPFLFLSCFGIVAFSFQASIFRPLIVGFRSNLEAFGS